MLHATTRRHESSPGISRCESDWAPPCRGDSCLGDEGENLKLWCPVLWGQGEAEDATCLVWSEGVLISSLLRQRAPSPSKFTIAIGNLLTPDLC